MMSRSILPKHNANTSFILFIIHFAYNNHDPWDESYHLFVDKNQNYGRLFKRGRYVFCEDGVGIAVYSYGTREHS